MEGNKDVEIDNSKSEDNNIKDDSLKQIELDDDDTELKRLSKLDRLRALEDVDDLYNSIHGLKQNYKIVDKLGEGTFSAVYKAIDLHHHSYDNSYWFTHDQIDKHQLSRKSKVYVALKRIYVTSCPYRIQNELEILYTLRHSKNISALITAFRYHDQVIAVMPYHRNNDFREFYRYCDYKTVKCYLRSMLRALHDVHKMNIIHRDVKPANFLYSVSEQKGVLCDFGLAQTPYETRWSGNCHHTIPTNEYPHGQNVLLEPKLQDETNKNRIDKLTHAMTEVDRKAADKNAHVGYIADDKRPGIRANRAGTRGFRAPEVLLKCQDQTTAIDIWSVGVILLSFLSRRFPFFTSNDDNEALMELSTIFGIKKMARCAALHNKTMLSNVPSIQHNGNSFPLIIYQLNPFIFPKPPSFWHHKYRDLKHNKRKRNRNSSDNDNDNDNDYKFNDDNDVDDNNSNSKLDENNNNSLNIFNIEDNEFLENNSDDIKGERKRFKVSHTEQNQVDLSLENSNKDMNNEAIKDDDELEKIDRETVEDNKDEIDKGENNKDELTENQTNENDENVSEDENDENEKYFKIAKVNLDTEVKKEVKESINTHYVKPWPEDELIQSLDLLKKLLTLDCTKRLTALEALNHPFLLYD